MSYDGEQIPIYGRDVQMPEPRLIEQAAVRKLVKHFSLRKSGHLSNRFASI